MARRSRPLPEKLLRGVAGLTVLLLAVSLVLALKPKNGQSGSRTEASGVFGEIIASPCRSAEQVGDPPCPGYYGEIRVLRPDDTLLTTAHTDRAGHYRIALPPGRYIIDPNDDGKSLANGNGHVLVREGTFTQVDLSHYTGMICVLGRTWLHAGTANAGST